jgi:uncharacterized protein (TIGR03435 family)
MFQVLNAGKIALAVFAGALAFGQPPESLTFEVASVKPAPVPTTGGVFFGPARGGPGTPDPGQITWSFVRLQDLLTTAYDVKPYQVSGPGWLATERYHVVVKVPAGATKEQVRVMWQNLIRERFALVLHHESKEFQVEDLVVGKDGSKLKQAVEDPDAAMLEGPPKRDKNGALDRPGAIATIFPGPDSHVSTVAKSQPLSHLTNMLGNVLGHPVIDKTGLSGKFDYTIDFKMVFPLPGPPGAGAAAPVASDPGPDVASAVQQQLGLRLVPGRAKLDVLVIDSAVKVPTEN